MKHQLDLDNPHQFNALHQINNDSSLCTPRLCKPSRRRWPALIQSSMTLTEYILSILRTHHLIGQTSIMRSHLPGMPESASCLPFSVSKVGSFWQQISWLLSMYYLLHRVDEFLCVAREHCYCDDNEDNSGGRQIQPAVLVLSSQWWQIEENLLDFSAALTRSTPTQSHFPSLLCDVIPDFASLLPTSTCLFFFLGILWFDYQSIWICDSVSFYLLAHTNTNRTENLRIFFLSPRVTPRFRLSSHQLMHLKRNTIDHNDCANGFLLLFF